MRLLHPRTIEIIVKRDDISKVHISRGWSEIFKWKASGQNHPKQFINDDEHLGIYLAMVYDLAQAKGCNLDERKLDSSMFISIATLKTFKGARCFIWRHYQAILAYYFDDNYLFSDACSLYYKGVNIFPDIFGDEWRKYVPVESNKEILRQVTKTLNK